MPDTVSTQRAASIVRSVLGVPNEKVESVLARAFQRCYDMEKVRKRLHKVLPDDISVGRLVSVVFGEQDADDGRPKKKTRFTNGPQPNSNMLPENGGLIVGGVLDKSNASEIMLKAQQMIEERKKALKLHPAKIAPDQAKEFMNESLARLTRVSDLQRTIRSKIPVILNTNQVERQPGEPQPLILDTDGRTVDAAGRAVNMTVKAPPTLKANLRAEKAASAARPSKGIYVKTEEPADVTPSYHDDRLKMKPAARSRRPLKFVKQGDYVNLANRLRAKSRLMRLEQEISQAAKKTGISSAVKFAMVAPKITDFTESSAPKIEWWDSVVLPTESYDVCLSRDSFPMVTNLVEHPIQLKAPGEHSDRRCLKVYLTKKEQKKLRRQNRKEQQREKTEKIRLGLEAPPEPKMKISNLMRVLSTQAVQDPTKMEAQVRQQMAKRLEKHLLENKRRKLTPAQRIAKRARKYLEEQMNGVHVAVFRVLDLSDPSRKFKVEMNAKQLCMHGIVVLHKDVNIVVVEGGPKQIRFYKNLMMNRIKWLDADVPGKKKATDVAFNKCYLIWEGVVKKRAFGDFKVKSCPMEKMARELFAKHGVEQYWDMAYSSAIMGDDEAATADAR